MSDMNEPLFITVLGEDRRICLLNLSQAIRVDPWRNPDKDEKHPLFKEGILVTTVEYERTEVGAKNNPNKRVNEFICQQIYYGITMEVLITANPYKCIHAPFFNIDKYFPAEKRLAVETFQPTNPDTESADESIEPENSEKNGE